MGQPFSIRLTDTAEQLVLEEARRTGRSKSAVVAAFTEEAARTQRFGGIGFRGDYPRRRAWVIGSGLDVWEIVHMVQDHGSPDRLVADSHLTQAQVHLALQYYAANSDEVDSAVLDNRRDPHELAARYPFVVPADT